MLGNKKIQIPKLITYSIIEDNRENNLSPFKERVQKQKQRLFY